MNDRIRQTFIDSALRKAQNLLYTGPGTPGSALAVVDSSLAALSVAHRSRLSRELDLDGPNVQAGGSGAYQTHQDMVTLYFNSADGPWPITIPAPNAAIFMADTETVDVTNQLVDDAITDCIATLTNKAGNALTSFRGGKRWFLQD